jgi:MFS transporter, SP family, general alpha glucoside:H+ symporter
LNPTALNIRGKAGFLFAGISLICIFWCYFRLPETRNRTFDEIDVMFHRGVPARKFADYKVIENLNIKSEELEV